MLFEKGYIGNVKIKNRIVMAPMGTSADADGGFSERSISYFVERAKGGTGLIISGMNIVTEEFEKRPRNLLNGALQCDRLSVLCDKLHQYGAKFFVQLGPGLGRMVYAPPESPPYSASECSTFWFPNVKCKALTVDNIKFLVKRMGISAGLAKGAGCDGVEIHAYGGYLIDQFISPLWNLRNDEYGGDLNGRMKFLLDIIAEIHNVCGKNYPISVKFTPYQGIPGGRELDEGVEIAKMLEKAGVAVLHVDVGCYEVWYKAISTVYQEEGHQLFADEAVKKAVKIPVIGQGKLFNPIFADQAIADGKLDFVALGHQLLSDPDWSNKVKAGKVDEIRPCIGCNECLYADFAHKEKCCAVNVKCYHEVDYKMPKPDGTKRSVLVVGGGPGGLNAAICAAERGFDVQLWEKSDKLGGLLLAAGAPIFKNDVMRYVEYLKHEAVRLGVDIKMLKEAKSEEIIAGNYDKVILASGSKALMPNIQGIEGENVISSIESLRLTKPIGKNIVVIGGGLVGCETALDLANSAEKVTIIELLDDILKTAAHSRNNDQCLRTMIKNCENLDVITSAKITSIDKDSIKYVKGDITSIIKCDKVVVAAGFKSVNNLEEALDGKVKDLSVIGDSVFPRKIFNAVHEGYHAIRLME